MIRRMDVARMLARGPATLKELMDRFPPVGKGTSNFIRGEIYHMRKAGLVRKDDGVWSLTEKGMRYVEGRRCGPSARSATTCPSKGKASE